MRPIWKVAIYIAVEAVVLSLVISGLYWGWSRSPGFRYQLLGTDNAMRDALLSLQAGDSIDQVRDLMGQQHLDPESEYSIRRGLQDLVQQHPEVFRQGYQETDEILVYSTRTRRYGLQFRDGRLIGGCSQSGTRIQPPPRESPESSSEGEVKATNDGSLSS